MQKLHRYIALYTFILIIASCKSDSNPLVNKWKLVEFRSQEYDKQRQELIDEIDKMQIMQDSIKNEIDKANYQADMLQKQAGLKAEDSIMSNNIIGSTLTIENEGIYQSDLMGNKESGKWIYNIESKQLITTPIGDKNDTVNVILVTKDSLKIGLDKDNYLLYLPAK
jgi:hypothetical protein